MFAGHDVSAPTNAKAKSRLVQDWLEAGHAVFVEAHDDAASSDDDGPADETWVSGHPGDGLATRRRVIVHGLLLKSLRAGIEKILVIAPADEFLQFHRA